MSNPTTRLRPVPSALIVLVLGCGRDEPHPDTADPNACPLPSLCDLSSHAAESGTCADPYVPVDCSGWVYTAIAPLNDPEQTWCVHSDVIDTYMPYCEKWVHGCSISEEFTSPRVAICTLNPTGLR